MKSFFFLQEYFSPTIQIPGFQNTVFNIKVGKSFWYPSPISCLHFFSHSIGFELTQNHGGRHGLVKKLFFIFSSYKIWFLVNMLWSRQIIGRNSENFLLIIPFIRAKLLHFSTYFISHLLKSHKYKCIHRFLESLIPNF